MNEKSVEFIQNQLLRGGDRLRPYTQDTQGKEYPRRFAYFRIQKYVDAFLHGQKSLRWVALPGISGVGKTTILAQLYKALVPRIDKNHILYISLDEIALLGLSIADVLIAYESVLGVGYENLSSPVILMVDEAHRDPEWSTALKVLWGKTNNVFIICTGSSAVLLEPHYDDIGRRMSIEKLYPLCFTEYEMIKGRHFPKPELKKNLNEALYGATNAETAYEALVRLKPLVRAQWTKYDRLDIDEYLNIGTIPFALQSRDVPTVYMAIDRIIDKMIQKDILQLGRFDSDTILKIKPLLYYLAESTTVAVSKVGGLFDLNKKTLQSILDVLVKAEVLIRVEPFKADNKSSKYLFMCPAIRHAMQDITGLKGTIATRRGQVLEDVVALHLYREFVSPGYGKISFDPASGGADFILDMRAGKRLVIEVGASEKTSKQVVGTIEKSQANFGIIISNDQLTLAKEENTVKVPYDFFYLM